MSSYKGGGMSAAEERSVRVADRWRIALRSHAESHGPGHGGGCRKKRLAHLGAVPGRALAARLDRQLVEDIGDVALDGVQTQIERSGDQLVAVASRDALQHLEFARSQSFITDRGVGSRGHRRRARRHWGGWRQ